MSWVTEAGFAKRPLVIVEDHLYHMTELLDGLGKAPDLVGQLTVVCLDRPGPDTRRTVAAWLAGHPPLQAVAAGAAAGLAAGSGGWGPWPARAPPPAGQWQPGWPAIPRCRSSRRWQRRTCRPGRAEKGRPET